MKPDSERTVRYKSKLNKKKDFLHVHLSKDLAKKLTRKKRSILVRKGDEIIVMRGSLRGKAGHVTKVNYSRSKVYIEGLTKRNAKGKETPLAFEPSNLMVINLESTKEREGLFREVVKSKLTEEKPHKKEHVSAENVIKVEDKK